MSIKNTFELKEDRKIIPKMSGEFDLRKDSNKEYEYW